MANFMKSVLAESNKSINLSLYKGIPTMVGISEKEIQFKTKIKVFIFKLGGAQKKEVWCCGTFHKNLCEGIK